MENVEGIVDKNAVENQKWLITPSTFTNLRKKKKLIFFNWYASMNFKCFKNYC
jgi:hypothetical protein